MRYVRLFSLFFQHVSEQRARTFVWFILSIYSPVIMILFWRGAATTASGWNASTITSYYLLLVVAGAMLMSHIEDDVARIDIQEGGLSAYLLKPFSYYWIKFCGELPWRAFQGIFGVVSFTIILLFFHVKVSIDFNSFSLLGALLMALFAYMISFTYKMILGMLAFWFTDISGVYQLSEMLIFIFAGYIVPLRLYPDVFSHIGYMLPFSYIVYFPIAALQGTLSQIDMVKIFSIQIGWIIGLYFLYSWMWKKGIKVYTGVGQ